VTTHDGIDHPLDYKVLATRYQRVLEVSRTISSTLDLPALLQHIVNAAAEVTETEAASILLYDSSIRQLRFEASTGGSSTGLDGITVPVESSIAGAIFTTATPVIIPDVSKDSRFFRKVDSHSSFVTRTILGVPLIYKEKPIGVLQALNKKNQSLAFTAEDVETLESLAAQAAVAIVNARLFQQSDLISEMVHEIRTPLSALTATSHILLRPSLTDEQRAEFVQMIQSETSRLSVMTTDFLDLAKLESGRMRFTPELFELKGLVSECVEVVKPQAEGRHVTLRVDLPPDLPTANADRGKIKQVLLNLLTNAVKYNKEHGEIFVSAQCIEEAIRVSVRDTGKGIPPHALPHMFEKFYRVPDSEGMAQGTGLGLPIAKRIVEVHGGKMIVESEVNFGTIFTFTLPLSHQT
jgi:signal transduction histidine kinase